MTLREPNDRNSELSRTVAATCVHTRLHVRSHTFAADEHLSSGPSLLQVHGSHTEHRPRIGTKADYIACLM